MEGQYLVLDIGGTFIKYAIMDREAQFIMQGKVAATSVIAAEVNRIYDSKTSLPYSKPEVVTCKFGNKANLIGALAFHLGDA